MTIAGFKLIICDEFPNSPINCNNLIEYYESNSADKFP